MLTEVDSRHPSHVNVVADAVSAAEEARVLRRDATAMVERMAVQARRAGVDHPVAAALALAARVSRLAGPEEFAERTGVPIARLVEAEAGAVRFGELPRAYGPVLDVLGVDLLSLADLEAQWGADGSAQGALF